MQLHQRSNHETVFDARLIEKNIMLTDHVGSPCPNPCEENESLIETTIGQEEAKYNIPAWAYVTPLEKNGERLVNSFINKDTSGMCLRRNSGRALMNIKT